MIEYLPLVLTGLSISASILYYSMVLRNAEKARRKDLVFQRIQAPIQFYDAYMAVISMTDWDTQVEFWEKYGPRSEGNPDSFVKFNYVINHLNSLGIMMKDGLAKPEEIFQLYLPYSVIGIFEKFQPIIMRSRITPSGVVHSPDAYLGYELLYFEAKKRYPDTPPLVASDEEAREHAKLIQKHLDENPIPK